LGVGARKVASGVGSFKLLVVRGAFLTEWLSAK
jgi:hypothetical protein